MEYKYNLKFQATYGLITFLSAAVVLYLITNKIDIISPFIIGFINFIISGYYSDMKKCK